MITELARGQGLASASYLPMICLLGRSAQLCYNNVVDLLLEAWDYLTGIVESVEKAVLLRVATARGNTVLAQDLLESPPGTIRIVDFIVRRSFLLDNLPTALC